MSNYLLDTNPMSPLVTLEHPLRARVLQQLTQGDTFAVSVPSITELLFGIGTLPRAAQNRSEWDRLRPNFDVYAPDEMDAQEAADLQIALRRRGRQLETVDALIAALALRYDLILLTTDRDFEALPDLPQENWLAK